MSLKHCPGYISSLMLLKNAIIKVEASRWGELSSLPDSASIQVAERMA
jgi:hypothetical protein